MEENEAVGMRHWTLWVGGWVGGRGYLLFFLGRGGGTEGYVHCGLSSSS